MKRLSYISRFARPLTKRDIDAIHLSATRYNREHGVTGILVCLGDMFFQELEGKGAVIDKLYNERILQDNRHQNVLCLNSVNGVGARMFPDWHMQIFNLNEETEVLPMAFRQALIALLESNHMISQYTQPSILRFLERGINPTLIKPRRLRATVLFSDIVGFSYFAERLKPVDLIDLVNSHIDACTQSVDRNGGQVNKLLGDGVLAYFPQRRADAAVAAATDLIEEMNRRRSRASGTSPHHLLYGGVGLANGMVYEGNIGSALKRDFTILGNTVNLASRLESLTRVLKVPVIATASVTDRARRSWGFQSLGAHTLKGQSEALEIFGLKLVQSLHVDKLYQQITGLRRSNERD
ncbi:BLUF domain-containing protein [Mesorhizobium sp. BAC0120]|uniref:BLUF domain-containing protein n=1 Tax=Mesorhizobium sp. BAC0120 TaxID=3090670 RepID=UPI00298D5FCF|nr:BLUF domain-containing protein [Mesorhizobium sp. BAC0120]MDW6023364.1 BLUF domain-containing protein [Mesorhizobium sp. BAC0120]